MKSLRHAQEGASTVEFALIASLLFMILFGTIQFGIAYNRYQGLQAGAREAARLGSLKDTTSAQIKQRAKDSVSIIDGTLLNQSAPCPSPPLNQGCIHVQRRNPDGTLTTKNGATDVPCAEQTGRVLVDITYRMPIEIPLWANIAINVTGSGEFACE